MLTIRYQLYNPSASGRVESPLGRPVEKTNPSTNGRLETSLERPDETP